jgi:hypothetical protein
LPVGGISVDFLVNDLSVEEQYSGVYDFAQAISQMMGIRNLTRRFGCHLFCHRNLLQAKVTPTMTMYDVVQMLAIDRRRAIMPWLTNHGPFWDDDQHHGSNEYFECNDCVVTDTALGEAAFCRLNGIERGLASFVPSRWEYSPVTVRHRIDDENQETIEVQNFWTSDDLGRFLDAQQPTTIRNWQQLEYAARNRFTHLFFSPTAFVYLEGHAFSRAAAQRFLFLFNTLNRLAQCFDERGDRTPEGHEIYQDLFTGDAYFSDSSDTEKHDFENELTFPHPENPDATLFCPWHGKVQTPQMRVHFSWPVRANETLYIVYVGPKITKR